MDKRSPSDYAIGSTVSFLAGPTKVPVTAEVVRHDGQFVVTKDSAGRERKVRPGSINA